MNNKLKVFVPLLKVDEEQRMVYGYASTEALDSQNESIGKAVIEAALPDYMRFANIREMHQLSAVGVAKTAEIDEKGLYLGAKVVDDAAWAKVKEGVYKGFSIGGRGRREGSAIVEMKLTEISLVDRPANPECVFDTWKADGADAVDLATGEPVEPVKKGMYLVSWAADILSSLDSLQQSAEWESDAENDNSPIPKGLRDIVVQFAGVLRDLVAEETKEMTGTTVSMADKSADITKAVNEAVAEAVAKAEADAKVIKAEVEAARGLLVRVGKALGVEDGAPVDDVVSKADELRAGFDEVNKAARDLAAQVVELKKQPVPPKGALRAVSKSADVVDDGEGTDSTATQQVAETSPISKNRDEQLSDALSEIRKAHQAPQAFGAVRTVA